MYSNLDQDLVGRQGSTFMIEFLIFSHVLPIEKLLLVAYLLLRRYPDDVLRSSINFLDLEAISGSSGIGLWGNSLLKSELTGEKSVTVAV